MKKVAITVSEVKDINNRTAELLKERGFAVSTPSKALKEEERISFLSDCDAVLAGMEPYTAAILDHLPKLKIIARRGVGVDAIDLEACAERGITVTKSIGGVEHPVAELDFAYMLHFSRNLKPLNDAMHRHEWSPILSGGVQGKTIGLIGFGGIGKDLATKAHVFGMHILYHTRNRDHQDQNYHAVYADLKTLLQQSDYVVLNVPLTDSTRNMIAADELRLMKRDAVLINTARGPVVNEADLAEALNTGIIRGAACDVFPIEPTTVSPLMDCENALLTPHTGTYTYQAVLDMNTIAAQSIIDYFASHA